MTIKHIPVKIQIRRKKHEISVNNGQSEIKKKSQSLEDLISELSKVKTKLRDLSFGEESGA